MAKVDFKLDDLKLRANLAELGPKINKYITVTTDFGATSGVKEMKLKAPWIDRTTNARSGLWTKPNHIGTGPIGFSHHEILFGHKVEYGIWLEIKKPHKGGRPIIMPTTIETGRAVMKTLGDLFDDLDHPKPPNPNVNTAKNRRGRSSSGARARAEARHAAAKSARSGRTPRTIGTIRTRRS